MPTRRPAPRGSRPGSRGRGALLLGLVVLVAGVGLAVWRGSGPLPDPEGCTASVGSQKVTLDPEQGTNASLIAALGVRRGLPARAVSIALATAYQESKVRNLAHGDRDSVGIFQQRPSQGWGTAEQIQDPLYAIGAFYDALERVPGFRTMRITEAAQRVQRSGFPEAYEAHAADARALASALTGYSPGGRFSCVVHTFAETGSTAAVRASLSDAFGTLTYAGPSTTRDLGVEIDGGLAGNRVGWAVAQYAVAHAAELRIHQVTFDGRRWRAGRTSEQGWTSAPSASSTVVGLALQG